MSSDYLVGLKDISFHYLEGMYFWVLGTMEGYRPGFLTTLVKKAVYAASTCIFAIGGAMVGTVVGAMKGNTTETGILRGAMIGIISGAITAVQLLESVADNTESISKAALLGSLVNGKVFVEWVVPALLKAYQWQIMDTDYSEPYVHDIYDVNGICGLPADWIKTLPEAEFDSAEVLETANEFDCSICLQDLIDGEMTRTLPSCGHLFHLVCIDEWLIRQASCPICREHVL